MGGTVINQVGPFRASDTPRVFWAGTPVGTAKALPIAPDGSVGTPTAMTALAGSGVWFYDFGGYVDGIWLVNVFDDNDPSGTSVIYQFSWGGAYETLCANAEASAESLTLRILESALPFVQGQTPRLWYLAGVAPADDVLIDVYDSTGAHVVAAALMTQLGGSAVWYYDVGSTFVSGQWSYSCYINNDLLNSQRTASFVWANAADLVYGSYPALLDTTLAIQNLADELHKKEFNRLKVDTGANTMTLYADDNNTPLYVWTLSPSATNILDRVPV